jgi:hypothetical protein
MYCYLIILCFLCLLVSTLSNDDIQYDTQYEKLHVFGIGQFKTGTTTLASIFSNYNSAHEPEKSKLFNIIYRNDKNEIMNYIKNKESRMKLDMDSSGFNYSILPYLVIMFPDAKFIMTRRNMIDLFNSVLQTVKINKDGFAIEVSKYYLGKPTENIPEQERVASDNYSMYWSIADFCKIINRVNRNILSIVPKNRLLIIDIDDGMKNIKKIAKFLNIPENSLTYIHSNKSEKYTKATDLMDPNYVEFIYNLKHTYI